MIKEIFLFIVLTTFPAVKWNGNALMRIHENARKRQIFLYVETFFSLIVSRSSYALEKNPETFISHLSCYFYCEIGYFVAVHLV